MPRYHVTYFYLATGMEGRADTYDYGVIDAPDGRSARWIVASQASPNLNVRRWVMGCLKARRLWPWHKLWWADRIK